ncbi:hypothetical protein [Sphingorhabdus sp. Alg231-15]|uniref:hypothetical protein n=1 Tax=Sphingorhabdus sp. Alg231-15 TaxID=1922222 RepID=UPI000D5629DE
MTQREGIDGKNAARYLTKLSDDLSQIASLERLEFRFKFTELNVNDFDPISKKFKDDLSKNFQSIYSFHLDSMDGREKFLDAIDHAKETKLDGLAYPRRNKLNSDSPSDCFYVGTSRNTFERLKGHLGFGAKSTYSLHLKCWASRLTGGFEIVVHKFDLDDEQLHLLTYIEDDLAREVQPMLGRRGNL